VALTQEHSASRFTDGTDVDFEIVETYVSAELACVVLIERMKARVSGSEDTSSESAVPVALRVTMTFRPEDGEWKVVHRHADSVTTAQPAESVVQR
jgi:ketosteroid isomerase-like protein